ncbi:MAG TPA: Gfo/Idh/MocA family oxidoreductase [Spirochaetia bacterium]|nr:Gfo/Idh/MocA family oxidoreductase [Spirochaetia bacterium]
MKPIRICMVGAGRVGKQHSRSILGHLPNAVCSALVDPNVDILEATGNEFEYENRFTSLEEALEAVEFDAVIITTPTFTHRELAVLAAGEGKHVFLEKPMALDLEECDDIIEATRKAKVILQIGFMRRFDPEFRAASERIQSGEIGRPMLIKSLTHGPGLPPSWAYDLKTSNGMLAEVNSHDWDTLRWLTSSNLERVYVETANFKGAQLGVTTEHFYDNVVVSTKFENGALGSISGICPCGYGYDARVEVVGEKGIIQIGSLSAQSVVVCTDRDKGLSTPIYRTWPERFAWGYINELKHFVHCISAEEEPFVTGEDGRWAVAGVLAANRSFLEGRPVGLAEVMSTPASSAVRPS